MKWHEWESNVIWFGWDVLSVRYSVCSGTMSGLYIYIGVCVCVHVCVCIDAHVSVLERIRVGVRASHAHEHICKSVSRRDLAKWAVHQFWFTSGNELAASWTSIVVEASRPPVASCVLWLLQRLTWWPVQKHTLLYIRIWSIFVSPLLPFVRSCLWSETRVIVGIMI